MSRRFKVLIEYDAEEAVWVTYVPALNHISTYGETREEALAQTEDMILGYLETAAEKGISVPPDDFDVQLVDLEVAVA